MDINYELYKVFYHVAKSLSFSDAAQELFISQSAVSQSIKVLERRLGQTLFIRSTKKVTLTKEGEILFKHIEPAITLIVKGESQLVSAKKSGEIQLRIAANDTICRYYLVPYLNLFHQSYPDVHIKITTAASQKCADCLEKNQADIIVTNSPNQALNNTMHILPLKEYHDIFLADKTAYPYEDKEMTLRELSELPIMMLEKNTTTSIFLHEQFLNHSIDLVPAIELNSNDVLIDLASIGLGIAFVPDYCITAHIPENLYIVKIKDKIPSRKLVAAYDAGLTLTKPAEFFLHLLTQDTVFS